MTDLPGGPSRVPDVLSFTALPRTALPPELKGVPWRTLLTQVTAAQVSRWRRFGSGGTPGVLGTAVFLVLVTLYAYFIRNSSPIRVIQTRCVARMNITASITVIGREGLLYWLHGHAMRLCTGKDSSRCMIGARGEPGQLRRQPTLD